MIMFDLISSDNWKRVISKCVMNDADVGRDPEYYTYSPSLFRPYRPKGAEEKEGA